MKIPNLIHLAGPMVLCATGALATELPPLLPGDGPEHGDPYSPSGTIQVTPTVVREGVQPSMTWEIEYPKSISDLFHITSSGSLVTINPESDKLGVRVVGASNQSGSESLPVALWIRVGGSGAPWSLLFYGAPSTVDPSSFLYSNTIHEGTVVDFAARAKLANGAWLPVQWTLRESPNVAALLQGDPMPEEFTPIVNGTTESYFTQFVSDNDSIIVGPREIVYLFELGSSTPGTQGFDMQDLVVVVSSAKNNNGHGNNLDGVDGIKKDGTLHDNKGLDPSNGIDDEGKIQRK